MTLLPTGQVLVTGGQDSCCDTTDSAELYIPSSNTWQGTGAMSTPRYNHTATLLQNGQVLVAGGGSYIGNVGNTYASAELYNPTTGTWTATGSMTIPRYYHTATLLPNGKVLVVGGCVDFGCTNVLASAELYDPSTGTWTATGSMLRPRYLHTATRLSNGKVLVTGGQSGSGQTLASAELYDPNTGTWTATGSMANSRIFHTATLLINGQVLVTGGEDVDGGILATAELYNPTTGAWRLTSSMASARYGHTATLLRSGQVLVVGGCVDVGLCKQYIASAELYDPRSGTWTATGSLATARANHTAVLLHSRQVLVAGGGTANQSTVFASAELYSPGAGPLVHLTPTTILFPSQSPGTTSSPFTLTVTNAGSASLTIFAIGLTNPAAFTQANTCTAPLAPGARCVVVIRFTPATAGQYNANLTLTDNAPNSPQSVPISALSILTGANRWSPTAGAMTTSRFGHTATLFTSGRLRGTVLVAGGCCGLNRLTRAELYNPTAGTWTLTGSMTYPREFHTATLLPTGSVLVAGGWNDNGSPQTSAELYNPSTGYWTPTGSMAAPRALHTATLLPNGLVLAAGGEECFPGHCGAIPDAELYNPAQGTWTTTGSMTSARYGHTATLLPNGKVLVAGGCSGNYVYGTPCSALASAELYDPATGAWMPTGSMTAARGDHTATLLPNGAVLVTGGYDSNGHPLSSAEVYNPTTGAWTAASPMATARASQTATLMPNGQVLVAGGCATANCTQFLATAEVYNPRGNVWSGTGSLTTARFFHTATLLFSGNVLVSGGDTCTSGLGCPLNSSELYTPGVGPLIHLTPNALSFGNQPFGTSSLSQTVLVTNTGTLPLAVTSVAITGSAAFTQTTTCTNGAIPVGASCAIYVSFSPASTGQYAATVLLTDNAPNSPQSVPLMGTGTGPDAWSQTGSMATGRANHTATLFTSGPLSGTVLVAGGGSNSAELYDPTAGTFTATGSMTTARSHHTATLLTSGGLAGFVLAAGGQDSTGTTLASTELYDPNSGQWFGAAPMNAARHDHTATLLNDGTVLVTGGEDGTGVPLTSAEIYDPNTGIWSPTGSMNTARAFHTATLLPNGKVLVAGGTGLNGALLSSAEVYNPDAHTWTATGSMLAARSSHTATLFASGPLSGKVLVAGGDCCGAAEIYDPASGTWTVTGSMTTPRSSHTATVLATGQVLIAGGSNSSGPLDSAELYDPSTGAFTTTGPMATARTSQTATLLTTGQVLVTGGCCDSNGASLASAELYTAHLNVYPSSGSVGQAITLTGTNFLPNESVDIYADGTSGTPIYSTTAGSDGRFVLNTSVAPLSIGIHQFNAVGRKSGAVGTAPFTVTSQLALSATTGVVESKIAASGTGFGPHEQVTLHWDGETGSMLGATTADQTGSFANAGAITFTVPVSPTGTYPVYAIGQSSGTIVSTTVTMSPSLSIGPSSGAHGSTVLVTGAGYGAHRGVTILWNCAAPTCTGGLVLGTAVASTSGAFDGLAVTIPATATVGTYLIGGLGSGNGAFAATVFQVTS